MEKNYKDTEKYNAFVKVKPQLTLSATYCKTRVISSNFFKAMANEQIENL